MQQTNIAGKILGSGAVAFIGSPRYGTAAQMFMEMAHTMPLLSKQGQSLGEASKVAHNSAMALNLDGAVGTDQATFENTILFGDPALVPLQARGPSQSEVGKATVEEDVITVEGPTDWHFDNTPIPAEWGATIETLYTPSSPTYAGVVQWNDEKRYNTTTMVNTVTVKSTEKVQKLAFIDGTDTDEAGDEIGYKLNPGVSVDVTTLMADKPTHWIRIFHYDQTDGVGRFDDGESNEEAGRIIQILAGHAHDMHVRGHDRYVK